MKKIIAFLVPVCLTVAMQAQSRLNFNKYTVSPQTYTITIPYENINNKMVVTINVEGKQRRFIFDTGASNIITNAVQQELKAPLITSLPVRDAGGKRDSMDMVRVASFNLNGVTFGNVPALVTLDAGMFSCFGADGLLGSNMFSKSVVRIDSRTHTMLVTDDIANAGVNDSDEMNMQLDMQSRPYVWVRFTKKVRQQVLFDTGDGKLYTINNAHYSKLKPEEVFQTTGQSFGSSSYSLHGRDANTETYRIAIPQLMVGKGVLTHIDAITSPGSDSRMGSKLLDYGVVTLDFPNKKFYFEPFASISDAGEKRWSVVVTYIGGKLVVGHVWDENLKGKISVGDYVIAIDGQDTDSIPACDMYTGKNVLAGTEKTSAEFTIRNADGMEQKITVNKL